MTRNVLQGFAAGTALMYFADPERGRRRRVVARDKVVAGWHDLTRQIDKAERDTRNRAHGIGAIASSFWKRAEADDCVLVERVRSAIGRAVSHPHAIQARVEGQGRIILEGPVLLQERDTLLRRVTAVAGVKEAVDRLQVHNEPGNIPNLQGGTPKRGSNGIAQQNWAPALRVAGGAVAGAIVCLSLRKRGPVRWIGTIAGATLLSRVIANKPLRQMAGLDEVQDAVVIDKTIHIHAPLEEVFAYWSNFQNFPRFMTHIKEVRPLDNGRSHWVAAGPGGIPIPWDAEITERKENQLLSWKSIPGSAIRTSGTVRFDRENDTTRIQIRMTYCPLAGVLGHSVARLFGSDPKTEMNHDLVGLKSLLETGKTRAHGEVITRDEIPVPAVQ